MRPKISVVIGYRDWGETRLRQSIKSIKKSLAHTASEVILSDYGSVNKVSTENLARDLDVRYVYTSCTGPWSRSKALNAGFAIAEGEIFVSTDADMLFSPSSFKHIEEIFTHENNCICLLQCRDLPEGYDETFIDKHAPDWDTLESISRIRPRWGMGGMMAISRSAFTFLRGYDERFHTYGGEDIDIAKRSRRLGLKLIWIDAPDARMYHMWHASTRNKIEASTDGQERIKANRKFAHGDRTSIRNIPHWTYPSANSNPLVSVAICTHNRAHFLKEAIQSVLNQTFQDFEILIIGDGISDDTGEVVEHFKDARIRYFPMPHQGISCARNMAADLARGAYTAVLDDDDLMHPRRLEWQVSSLEEGTVGNVGAFVNFENTHGTMRLVFGDDPSTENSLRRGGAPGHSTWLIKTSVLKQVRYDEGIQAAVDNNIFLRILLSGYKFSHTGKPLTLRREHHEQVSQENFTKQADAANDSFNYFKWSLNPSDPNEVREPELSPAPSISHNEKVNLINDLKPFLPDHLVKRSLVYNSDLFNDSNFDGDLHQHRIHFLGEDKENTDTRSSTYSVVVNATYADMVRLRRNGVEYSAQCNLSSNEYDIINIVVNQLIPRAEESSRAPIFAALVPAQSNAFDVYVGTKPQLNAELASLPSHAGVLVIGDTILEQNIED